LGRRHDNLKPWLSSGRTPGTPGGTWILPTALRIVGMSSFAIHHLDHNRKRELYREIHHLLNPGGVFCNLEHVSSPPRLHARWQLLGIDQEPEDPSNRCLDVETQLGWLRELGYRYVDCYWKWMEMALLCGIR